MNNRILALFVLVLAAGLFFGYVNPTWNGQVAELKAAIASNNAALVAAKNYRAREGELRAARDTMSQEGLARLNTMLPDAVDNVGLILSLNALAARSGLSITSIDVSGNTAQSDRAQQVATSPVSSIDLSLSATGTYAAFQTFLAGIERSMRLLDVRSIDVNGSNSGLYTYNVSIRLYWLR